MKAMVAKVQEGFAMATVEELFGINVFNDSVMRQRLPKETYKALHKTIDEGRRLDPEVASVVANAMKDWALERGATHYTHWFPAERSSRSFPARNWSAARRMLLPCPTAVCVPPLRPGATPPGIRLPMLSLRIISSASRRRTVPGAAKRWTRKRRSSVPWRR